jgi:hypothetical protein
LIDLFTQFNTLVTLASFIKLSYSIGAQILWAISHYLALLSFISLCWYCSSRITNGLSARVMIIFRAILIFLPITSMAIMIAYCFNAVAQRTVTDDSGISGAIAYSVSHYAMLVEAPVAAATFLILGSWFLWCSFRGHLVKTARQRVRILALISLSAAILFITSAITKLLAGIDSRNRTYGSPKAHMFSYILIEFIRTVWIILALWIPGVPRHVTPKGYEDMENNVSVRAIRQVVPLDHYEMPEAKQSSSSIYEMSSANKKPEPARPVPVSKSPPPQAPISPSSGYAVAIDYDDTAYYDQHHGNDHQHTPTYLASRATTNHNTSNQYGASYSHQSTHPW